MRLNAKFFALNALATGLLIASQSGFAHTRLQSPSIPENTRVYNNAVISHGCHNVTTNANTTPVIAHELVFPDGTDSIVSNAADSIGTQVAPNARNPIGDMNGDGTAETVDTILQNWGNVVQGIVSHDVFDKASWVEKYDALGNVVGYSYLGGNFPGTATGLIPFKTDAVLFMVDDQAKGGVNVDGCAKSVTFELWGAEICTVTKITGLADVNVNMWTPAVGSKYDGVGLHGYNSPATLKINRDLIAHPLASYCGTGWDARVTPSAAQINRDAPLKRPNGIQYWPAK